MQRFFRIYYIRWIIHDKETNALYTKHAAASVEETMDLGQRLGERLKAGDVVGLYGGLGAGKTVFVKGIARGMGIFEEVTSPTFTLMRQYQAALPLCHFDLYRIEEEQELEHIGFYDYIGADCVCVVEWAGHSPGLRPDICVHIDGSGDDERIIEISHKEDLDEYSGD
jgi:tRNA threonylcarbamoyladenosine biosynthesis protein TsaE